MKKIIEMKKDAFLKKIKNYVFKKKESPVKLHVTPKTLSAIKIRFVFPKPFEITLMPQNLLFFKDGLLKMSKANLTDSDSAKKYYFRFCAPLIEALTKSGIYVGQNAEEKFDALETYLKAVKDDKIIFEIISGVDLNVSAMSLKSGGHEDEKSEKSDRNSGATEDDLTESDLGSLIDNSRMGSTVGLLTADLERRKDIFLEESKKRLEEQEFVIRGLQDKVDAYKRFAEQSDLQIKERGLKIEILKESLQNLEAENVRLKAWEAEVLEGKGKEEEDEKIEVKDGDDDIKDDGIDILIGDIEDEEIDKSLHISEAIGQWNAMVFHSRNEPVSTWLYDKDKDANERRTLPAFLVIAMLEREKAAHFSNTSDPWLKEEALGGIKRDCYEGDLKCLSLYQNLPPELKRFAITFVFWEMAHHNRFYRNALRAVLNGGKIPETLGIVEDRRGDADQTDIFLKLLHYTDAMRILMGHYGYIAQHQFDMDLFIHQDETIARFHGEGNGEGIPPDICRNMIESTLFM